MAFFSRDDVNIKISADSKSAESTINNFSSKTKRSFEGLRSNALAYTASLVAMSLIVKKLIALSTEQEVAEKKLEVILKKRANATDEQIQSIKDLTVAQQKLGIIGDEVQLSGAQQLATFLNTTQSLEMLIPAMNNLIAQQKGFNATSMDAVNIANMMGKVFVGQVGSLTRVGISFTKAQGIILKTGTEMEKASMLAQVLTDNVGNMNAELGGMEIAKIYKLKMALGDLGETLGKVLAPAVTKTASGLNALLKSLDATYNIIKQSGDRWTITKQTTQLKEFQT